MRGFLRTGWHKTQAGAGRAGEKGIALLMTLGILSLLLILAMSFAFTARTERMASGVNADMIRARLLCESGLERAIGFLRKEFSGKLYPGAEFYDLSDASTEAGWTDRGGRYVASISPGVLEGIESALASVINPSPTLVRFTPETTLYASAGANVGWIPIIANQGAVGEDSCVALLSYLIIDESGKIDPSAVVDVKTNEASVGSANAPTERTGQYETEVCLADAVLGGFQNDFRPDDVTGGVAPAGFMPAGGRWSSMWHVVKSLGLNQTSANACFRALHPGSYDIEAYYDSAAPVTDRDKHRFCLTPSGWSWENAALFDTGPEVDNLQNVGTVFWGTVPSWNAAGQVNAPVPFVDTVVGGSGIRWLLIGTAADIDGIGGAGTGADCNLVQRQTSANIVDYCDTNGAATSDYTAPVNDWTGAKTLASATYVGLERCPYINEVQVVANLSTLPLVPSSTFQLIVTGEHLRHGGQQPDLGRGRGYQ